MGLYSPIPAGLSREDHIARLSSKSPDGWVPYPFFNPATGYRLVFAYVLGIAVLTVVTAAIVWALSRLKLVKLEA